MIRYIDEHKGRFGVEPICVVLGATAAGFLSVSGYYAAKRRPPSARALRDGELKELIVAEHEANYGVYGVRKMHAALRRRQIHQAAVCPKRNASPCATRLAIGSPRPKRVTCSGRSPSTHLAWKLIIALLAPPAPL